MQCRQNVKGYDCDLKGDLGSDSKESGKVKFAYLNKIKVKSHEILDTR